MSLPLELVNLKKRYKNSPVEAVRGVSFEVRAGEIFGLLGPNGAGKTTIIASITTLEKPTSGAVKVFGVDVAEDPLFTKRNVGVVHQEVINSGFFSVEEILHFVSGYYGINKNQERIRFLLHKLSLFQHKDKKVKQLSGGMKRRLMIAKALVHNPKVLLLDEPTAGVDIQLREDLWRFVQELRQEGMSILLTTHYLEEAEHLCDRVGIINLGSLIEIGNTRDIITKYTHKKISIKTKEPLQVASKFLMNTSEDVSEFVVPQGMALGDLIAEASIPTGSIVDVIIKEGDLADAFVKLVNQGISQ